VVTVIYPGKDPVQLTNYKALTEQTDTLQSPSSSADDHQSASHRVRKWSTDSGTGRDSNHSNHSHQDTQSSSTQAPDTEGQDGDDHSLMNINQSLAELRAILERLINVMQIIESQVQSQTQRESHSLSASSSDSTFNRPPFSFPRRVDSESKTFEQRRLEIKKKQVVKLRSESEPVRRDVSIYRNYLPACSLSCSTKLILNIGQYAKKVLFAIEILACFTLMFELSFSPRTIFCGHALSYQPCNDRYSGNLNIVDGRLY